MSSRHRATIIAAVMLGAAAHGAGATTVGVEWEIHGNWRVLARSKADAEIDPATVRWSKRLICTKAHRNGYPVVAITYDQGTTQRTLEIVTAPIAHDHPNAWKFALARVRDFTRAVIDVCASRKAPTCVAFEDEVVTKLGADWEPCDPGPQPKDWKPVDGRVGFIFTGDPTAPIEPSTNSTQVNVAVALADVAQANFTALYGDTIGASARLRVLRELAAAGRLSGDAAGFLTLYFVAMNVYYNRWDDQATAADLGGTAHGDLKNDFDVFSKAPLRQLYVLLDPAVQKEVDNFLRTTGSSASAIDRLRVDAPPPVAPVDSTDMDLEAPKSEELPGQTPAVEISEYDRSRATKFAAMYARWAQKLLVDGVEPVDLAIVTDPVAPFVKGGVVTIVIENRLATNVLNKKLNIAVSDAAASFVSRGWADRLLTYLTTTK